MEVSGSHGITVERISYDEKTYGPYIEHIIRNYMNIFAVEYFERRHAKGLPPFILGDPEFEAEDNEPRIP